VVAARVPCFDSLNQVAALFAPPIRDESHP